MIVQHASAAVLVCVCGTDWAQRRCAYAAAFLCKQETLIFKKNLKKITFKKLFLNVIKNLKKIHLKKMLHLKKIYEQRNAENPPRKK